MNKSNDKKKKNSQPIVDDLCNFVAFDVTKWRAFLNT